MRFVFLMDPLYSVNQDKDSTFALMLEAQKRGHIVYSGHPQDLWMDHNRPKARLHQAKVMRGTPHFELKPIEDVYLDETDAVFMRKDPPFDMTYIFSTYILDQLLGKVLVINDPIGLKVANEKMYTLNFPTLTPRTLVSRDISLLRGFLDDMGGEMIVKPWDGNGGRGVLLVSKKDRNLSSLLELATGDGKNYVIAQQYVPEVRLGDKRIILVNGEPRGGILRVPAETEHRGNMHVGATVHKTHLTDRDLEICAAIGPSLRKDGLLFVGIDVIGNYLTEINVTSPTGIQELDAFDGLCVEGEIIDHVEGHVNGGRRRLAL